MSNIKVTDQKYSHYCVEQMPEGSGIVIFGASGDLTSRKIIPALWNLYRRTLIPNGFFIIGVARTELNDESFRKRMQDALELRIKPEDRESLHQFLELCHYVAGSYDDPALYSLLKERLLETDRDHAPNGGHIFYLATPPDLFCPIVSNLHQAELTKELPEQNRYQRIVIEKPFGHDLVSARQLDKELHRFVPESQLYRIDHYLGKETVQNLLMLRFANTVFEPVWNRQYIDNIQITAAESVGVEHRAGYYDRSGCLRDMFQNHMMQMLALVTMEPATSFDADPVRDEKVKVLRSIRALDMDRLDQSIIRGQYRAADSMAAYRDEPGVAENSITPTFAASRFFIDNWRWRNVPIYIRSGKRMPRKLTEIVITFKHVPHSMFAPFDGADLPANMLILNVQPEEGFSLKIQAKHPGPKLCMSTLDMSFEYKDGFGIEIPEAYERLILDAMLGDQTLFIRSDTLEQTWGLYSPVLDAWEAAGEKGLAFYDAGTWGPAAADELPALDNNTWHNPAL